VAHRSAPERIAIAQVRQGGAARFELCLVDACPKPTPKTLAVRAQALAAPPPAAASASLSPREPTASPSPTIEPVHETLPVPPIAAKAIVVTFASESALLSAAARRQLEAIVPDAQRSSAIEIRGRTDELGSAGFNELLARNRALAVRDYLRAQHLPEATTIRLTFKGACCYVAGNDTAEGRAANRRVEIEWQRGVQVAQRTAS
jgi:outer membrane protein OmpA-like peptidoglycan-associated protein